VIFAGLVFQPLSSDFMKVANTQNPDIWFHYRHFLDAGIYLERPEVVVLSQILQDPINTDLQDFRFSIVKAVNGVEIRTLEDLYGALSDPALHWEIQFIDTGRPIILQRADVETAHLRILESNKITQAAYLEDSIVPEAWLEGRFPERAKRKP
jgi:hypothetical protein